MSLLPLGVGVACAALASAAAFADGALLSVSEGAVVDGPAGSLVGRRDEAHRSLTLLRRVLQLAAGAAIGIQLDLPSRDWLEAAALSLAAALVVVVLTESTARAAGDAMSADGLRRVTPFVQVAEIVLAPFARLGLMLDKWLRGALPEPVPDEEDREEAVEQFSAIVAAEADVSGAEERVMRRVFALGDTEVRAVMVPRVDVVGIAQGTPWSEVIERALAAQHSRLPVYRETIDDIVGVLFVKDLLGAVVDGDEPEAGWESLTRPLMFYPPSKPCDALLREFRASGTHFAVIADEYGGTAGIVTIEDLLEELVGDIRDETDDAEVEIESGDDGVFWVDGRSSLTRLAEVTERPFERDGIATIGGLVLAELGRVPRPGEAVEIEGYRVVVERVRRRGVARVYLEPIETVESPDEADDL